MLRLHPALSALLAFPVPLGRWQEGHSGLPGSPKGEEGFYLLGDQLLAPHVFSSPGWGLTGTFFTCCRQKVLWQGWVPGTSSGCVPMARRWLEHEVAISAVEPGAAGQHEQLSLQLCSSRRLSGGMKNLSSTAPTASLLKQGLSRLV